MSNRKDACKKLRKEFLAKTGSLPHICVAKRNYSVIPLERDCHDCINWAMGYITYDENVDNDRAFLFERLFNMAKTSIYANKERKI